MSDAEITTSGNSPINDAPAESVEDSQDAATWYTDRDGNLVPITNFSYKDEYVFNPKHFAQIPYPATWPPGRPWPPQSVEELCCAPGPEGGLCHGTSCFTTSHCLKEACNHAMKDWSAACGEWETHIELRMTPDRGVGAFTKKPIKRHDVLGWYSGETTSRGTKGSDYKLSLDIGKAPSKNVASHGPHSLRLERSSNGEWVVEEITIDAKEYGNWTRFINHSCKPNTAFASARIGLTRIMIIKALQNVEPNTELTISYGEGYFRHVVCLCGAEDCLQKKKDENKQKKKDGDQQKAKDDDKQKAKAGASKKG